MFPHATGERGRTGSQAHCNTLYSLPQRLLIPPHTDWLAVAPVDRVPSRQRCRAVPRPLACEQPLTVTRARGSPGEGPVASPQRSPLEATEITQALPKNAHVSWAL